MRVYFSMIRKDLQFVLRSIVRRSHEVAEDPRVADLIVTNSPDAAEKFLEQYSTVQVLVALSAIPRESEMSKAEALIKRHPCRAHIRPLFSEKAEDTAVAFLLNLE